MLKRFVVVKVTELPREQHEARGYVQEVLGYVQEESVLKAAEQLGTRLVTRSREDDPIPDLYPLEYKRPGEAFYLQELKEVRCTLEEHLS